MQPFIFIRCDGRFVKVVFADIMYLEAKQNYVQVVTVQKTLMALISLRQLEKELPSALFCRVHRSFIVSIDHVVSFDNDMVQVDKEEIPISQQFRQALSKRVRVVCSDTRNRQDLSKLNINELLQ